MLKKLLPLLLAGGFAFSACAAGGGDAAGTGGAPGAEAAVRKAVEGLGPGIRIDQLAPAPLPGFYQVIASGHLVYVSSDGRYMLDGSLVDLARRKNVTRQAWAPFRKAELAKLPPGQGIVFSPPHPKYKITVFTDVNCGYCRAFHEQIAAINKEGIAVEYLAWPREGVTTASGRDTPTYDEMVSVWCAADRNAAFTAAKLGNAPKRTTCANPVKAQYDLGVKLGVDATPTIIDAQGRVLGGFVEPARLLKMLEDGDSAG